MQILLRFATFIPISLLIACGGAGGGGGGGGGNQLSNATVGAKTQYATSASATLSNSKSTSLSQILTGITIPSSVLVSNETTTYLTVWTGSDTERNQLLFMTVAKLRVMNTLTSGNSLQVPLGTTVVSYEIYDASGTIIKSTVTL